MSLAVVFSRALSGLDAPLVRVEVHVGGGLPGTNIVGLPEKEVREARDRVRAALNTANFRRPDGRVTVNLAPADLPKESGRFDLPIAIELALQPLDLLRLLALQIGSGLLTPSTGIELILPGL